MCAWAQIPFHPLVIPPLPPDKVSGIYGACFMNLGLTPVSQGQTRVFQHRPNFLSQSLGTPAWWETNYVVGKYLTFPKFPECRCLSGYLGRMDGYTTKFVDL